MKIRRTSPRTGEENVMDIDVTIEQYANWQRGALIQNAMPNLTSAEREFIMTGYTSEDWDFLFADWDEVRLSAAMIQNEHPEADWSICVQSAAMKHNVNERAALAKLKEE